MQAALATGDPAGLCPLGDVIARYDDHTAGWPLVRAMCAALGGHADQAAAELAAVRRRRGATGIDLHLAEKAIGRESCRDQCCPYVYITVCAVTLKKKIQHH